MCARKYSISSDENNMTTEKTYLYGPVPSRRLGLSLGVDVVPYKICSIDCIYCQLGRTTEKTIERRDLVPMEKVLAELKDKLAKGLKADFITFSGSGEPTLNIRLGDFIEAVKDLTDIKIAVLTNGTLLYREDVRADCAKADVVLPSLDAADEATFAKINRPHSQISIENHVEGLCAFRKQFAGQIWLEVFIVKGINSSQGHIVRFKKLIERIKPDRIQLNTAVRPTTLTDVKRLEPSALEKIANQLGAKAEVIADFQPADYGKSIERDAEDVLSMLKRRPCSLEDICSGLGLTRNEVLKYIAHFQQEGCVDSQQRQGKVFFKAVI
ncbi:MAG: radical SAM protein [Sedimentisphaerales bacterium]|nr:radical SAM protein [Sedimentisphaerales bacterium]